MLSNLSTETRDILWSNESFAWVLESFTIKILVATKFTRLEKIKAKEEMVMD